MSGWAGLTLLVLYGALMGWAVRGYRRNRAAELMFREFIIEIETAGGYDRMTPERRQHWLARLRRHDAGEMKDSGP